LRCVSLHNSSKRGVVALAQSLATFVNLRVLEIRENPGVGGFSLLQRTSSFSASLFCADSLFAVHFSVLAQGLQLCSNLKVQALLKLRSILEFNAAFVDFAVLHSIPHAISRPRF
jgi:hypothetical protein